jgi:hypothetical protein
MQQKLFRVDCSRDTAAAVPDLSNDVICGGWNLPFIGIPPALWLLPTRICPPEGKRHDSDLDTPSPNQVSTPLIVR